MARPVPQIKRFLVESFGSTQGLLSFLRAYSVDYPPSDAAVAKWFYRGSIPADWLFILLAYLQIDRGSPVDVAAYLGE
jgi:hypothetical protein